MTKKLLFLAQLNDQEKVEAKFRCSYVYVLRHRASRLSVHRRMRSLSLNALMTCVDASFTCI